MKKIVPFKHEIPFKTKISEITSISLEHTLHKEEGLVTGEFIISGEYKIEDNSPTNDKFSYELPFNIDLDSHYDISNAIIDINDFYYEILNEDKLFVNIEIDIDKIVEKHIEKEKQVITIDANDIESETNNKMENSNAPIVEENRNVDQVVSNIIEIENIDSLYVTYHIHIVREGDTINTILEKYHITNETLCLYNDITDLKIGDKLLIPANEN